MVDKSSKNSFSEQLVQSSAALREVNHQGMLLEELTKMAVGVTIMPNGQVELSARSAEEASALFEAISPTKKSRNARGRENGALHNVGSYQIVIPESEINKIDLKAAVELIKKRNDKASLTAANIKSLEGDLDNHHIPHKQNHRQVEININFMDSDVDKNMARELADKLNAEVAGVASVNEAGNLVIDGSKLEKLPHHVREEALQILEQGHSAEDMRLVALRDTGADVRIVDGKPVIVAQSADEARGLVQKLDAGHNTRGHHYTARALTDADGKEYVVIDELLSVNDSELRAATSQLQETHKHDREIAKLREELNEQKASNLALQGQLENKGGDASRIAARDETTPEVATAMPTSPLINPPAPPVVDKAPTPPPALVDSPAIKPADAPQLSSEEKKAFGASLQARAMALLDRIKKKPEVAMQDPEGRVSGSSPSTLDSRADQEARAHGESIAPRKEPVTLLSRHEQEERARNRDDAPGKKIVGAVSASPIVTLPQTLGAMVTVALNTEKPVEIEQPVSVEAKVSGSYLSGQAYLGGAQVNNVVTAKPAGAGAEIKVTGLNKIPDSMIEIRTDGAKAVHVDANEVKGGQRDGSKYVTTIDESNPARPTAGGKLVVDLKAEELANVATIERQGNQGYGERVTITFNDGKKLVAQGSDVELAVKGADGKLAAKSVSASMDDLAALRVDSINEKTERQLIVKSSKDVEVNADDLVKGTKEHSGRAVANQGNGHVVVDMGNRTLSDVKTEKKSDKGYEFVELSFKGEDGKSHKLNLEQDAVLKINGTQLVAVGQIGKALKENGMGQAKQASEATAKTPSATMKVASNDKWKDAPPM